MAALRALAVPGALGDPDYRPEADVNRNGRVDLRDLRIVARPSGDRSRDAGARISVRTAGHRRSWKSLDQDAALFA
jgi:hypothetical protein